MLVGTKLDLKKEFISNPEKRDKIVPDGEGLKAVEKYHLFKYVECSAKSQENLDRVFSDAIRSVFNYRQLLNTTKRVKKSKCSIL